MKQTTKQAPQSIFEVTFDIARRLEREAEAQAEAARAERLAEQLRRQEAMKEFRATLRGDGLATEGLKFDSIRVMGKGRPTQIVPAFIYSHMTGMAYVCQICKGHDGHKKMWSIALYDNGPYQVVASFLTLNEALAECVRRWGEFEPIPSDAEFMEAEASDQAAHHYLGCPRWMVDWWRSKKS